MTMKELAERRQKEWQLMKVEMRLSCGDGGGDWRENLLAQQNVLRAALRASQEPTQ